MRNSAASEGVRRRRAEVGLRATRLDGYRINMLRTISALGLCAALLGAPSLLAQSTDATLYTEVRLRAGQTARLNAAIKPSPEAPLADPCVQTPP